MDVVQLFNQPESDEHYGLSVHLFITDGEASVFIQQYSEDPKLQESEDVGSVDLSAEQFEAIAAAYFAAKKG